MLSLFPLCLCPSDNTLILDSRVILRCISQVQNLSSFKLAVQADPVVNLEFMKESLNETLIPCLVIKTSWHKLSTVLGHGGSSFYLQGSKKCSDWLSLSRKTHTHPGRTHIDYLSKFLSAASSRPAALMQTPLPYHPLSAVKNQYSVEKAFFLPQTTGKDQGKWEEKHKKNEIKQVIVWKMNAYFLIWWTTC